MHIVPFPEFVSLEIHHKELLEEITNRFPTYSDFNFISLFSWDTEASIALSILNDNLVVRFSDYENSEIFLSFIGTSQLLNTLETLFDYIQKHKLPNQLRLIPEIVINALPSSSRTKYDVSESRDNHDYILSVKKITELGSDYQRKRKTINRFKNKYGDVARHGILDLDSADIIADIQTVMKTWRQSRKRQEKEDAKEFTAINRTLHHAKQLNIQAYGLFIDNIMIAFTLFELAPERTAIFHFSKANVEFEGVFEYLKYSLCQYLETLDVHFINIEQDLGVPGLRQAKESYKPIKFLKKYTITPQA